MDGLLPQLLHRNLIIFIEDLLLLQKTLFENFLQVVKSCMSTFCISHLIPCVPRISPQMVHHHLNNLGLCHTLMDKSIPLIGRCSKHDTSSSITIISPNGRWKLDVSVCHLFANAKHSMWSIWL